MFANILIRILTVVYFIAVNLYSFILLKMQKNARDVGEDSIRDIRLYIVALLGGGLGIYLAMFIFKYRLKNFLLMVLMPLALVGSIYLIIMAFLNNFWF